MSRPAQDFKTRPFGSLALGRPESSSGFRQQPVAAPARMCTLSTCAPCGPRALCASCAAYERAAAGARQRLSGDATATISRWVMGRPRVSMGDRWTTDLGVRGSNPLGRAIFQALSQRVGGATATEGASRRPDHGNLTATGSGLSRASWRPGCGAPWPGGPGRRRAGRSACASRRGRCGRARPGRP